MDHSKNVLDHKTVRVVHHGGTSMGAISLLVLFPEYNTSIVMMMNRGGGSGELFRPVYALAREIRFL